MQVNSKRPLCSRNRSLFIIRPQPTAIPALFELLAHHLEKPLLQFLILQVHRVVQSGVALVVPRPDVAPALGDQLLNHL